MENSECKPPPVEKKEKPVEDLIDWDSYYKNRGLISTRMAASKAEYMHCSTYQEKGKNQDKGKGQEKDKKAKGACCCSSCPVRNREEVYEARCPGPGQKGKPNREYMRCFAAKMIVQRLDMPGRDFECRDKLQVKANVCRGCKICLDATSINVNCLPVNPNKTFQAEAECLQRQLAEGITISVVYMRKEIARGCYFPPAAVVHRMVNEFDEIVHDANVELTCKGCTVGLVNIRFSMKMSCQTIKEVAVGRLAGGQDRGCGSTGNQNATSCMDMNVDPQDASFMSSSSIDPCVGFMPSDMDEPIEPQYCSEDEEQKLCECQSPPPRLIDMAGPYPVYSCPNVDDGCVTFEPPAGPATQFSSCQRNLLGEGSTNRLCQKYSSPKLRQMHIGNTRSCVLCGEDVSWLPKVAACPSCGYKPVPEFKERPYDEEATAQQILLDHLENPVEDISFDLGSVEGCSGSGEHGDLKRTSEAFEAIVRDYQVLRRSIKETSHTKEVEAVSKNLPGQEGETKTQDLAKVFAELRDLFQVKVPDEKQKIQDICTEACNLAKSTKKGKNRCASPDRNKGGKADAPADDCGMPPKPKKRRLKAKRPYKSKYYSMYRPREGAKVKKDCLDEIKKVPGHMGWLWTAHPLASKPGWRPGAIRRSIRGLMRYFLKDFPVDSIPVSKYMSYYNNKKKPKARPCEKPEELVQVPTLHIEKKNDVYTITLRPLKDAKTLLRSANPYVKMKPVQFRIVKNPLLKELRDVKRCLKGMGFSKCSCHKPLMTCYCRSFVEKKTLISHVRKECKRRKVPSFEDDLVLTDTSDSEAEFDFGVTPPAGLMHPERLKSSHVKHTETQYDEADWVSPSLYPHMPDATVQYAGCVMGERQKPLKWIYGKGVIQEEPKPPKMRNIPKKPKKKKPEPGRVAGGYAGQEYQDSCIYNRVNNISTQTKPRPRVRTIGPIRTPPDYSTDPDLPLSGNHMRLLDQAAYPPTSPHRQEPWSREMGKERQKQRTKRRTKKMVRFDSTIEPRSSDISIH
ncbi:uncharacterized protein LOC108111451 [Drosophila eugracilis]|uniref:uncharacterized protein LOC108111451 n=1 Tax=Drosophila eugracilis TaxID=29029 RepID=UPI001BDA8349|nr:uncharacterized protein LOC108111451 [Drosophila eugracilis]